MTDGLFKDRVTVALARLALDNVKSNVIATFVASTILLLMLLQQAPRDFLIPWYIVFLVLLAARYYQVSSYEKTPLTIDNVDQTLRIFSVLVFFSGCMWGVLGIVYVHADNPVLSVVLLMIYTGLVANASATMASVLPLYLFFVSPILIPTAYKFYLQGDQQNYWITALIILYLTVSFINTFRIRTALRRLILLSFENLELIENLKTENSKTESALEKAEEANQAKSRFFAAASHDLRQPLQSLSMFTTTLAAQLETKSQKKIVSHIDNSVRSLEGLFNALLDISTLDAGTIKLGQKHFYLKPLVEEIAAGFHELTIGKPLTLNVDIDDVVVYSDPVLLNRVLQNLVENAYRYTRAGSVTIATELVGDKVSLSVSDTGVGIPEENRDRIFEEFVQLNNPGRNREKGLGLGLSIVNRICNLLNMPLRVESVVGEGSVFTVDIALGDSTQVTQNDVRNSVFPANLNDMFVLVIDDEEHILLAMEGLLEAWGCSVMIAKSGAEAIQQLIEYGSCPDAIITDYRLKDNETGGDALELIRKHCQTNVPAIIITGDIAPDRLLEIDKLNLPVLHKPCNADQLQHHLRSIRSAVTDHE
ncbi:MAG: hybrid sensor histidine kinase/response regulator [Gammaproteobacteria bacterium]|nr:hybrid sensor histidine kinase/response regulator [Gammaproteobacteria bacterium]